MDDSLEAFPQGATDSPRWLLFIHQLPPKPDYLRVKVRRRLKGMAAVPIKQTVYLLANTSESLEDFHWLREEIESEGGSAMIAEVTFVEGLPDEEIEAMLEVEQSEWHNTSTTQSARPDHVNPGQTWVTRANVHVDRMASAWLILRFIDSKPQFKFVPARGYKSHSRELRFDMFEAEYTHVGEDCTFQTLVRRFALNDRALATIGEIVHDIDCKDEQFGHAETRGIASLVRGIANAHDDDAARIERGNALFDDLYASFRKRRA